MGEEIKKKMTPLVVVSMGQKVTMTTMQWFMGKLKDNESDGGAELLAYKEKGNPNPCVYIGAVIERLLDGAELMEIKKVDNEGTLREFCVAEVDCFIEPEADLDNLLCLSEKQKIILHELENVRFQEKDKNIRLDHCNKHPYSGQSMLRYCMSEGLIKSVFPLHDDNDLKCLAHDWYKWNKTLTSQPLGDIRNYFGETIAMYFAFLGHYTVWLIPPAIVGLLYWCTSWRNVNRHAVFAVFNVLWTIVFMKTWNRRCASLAYSWGTLKNQNFEETRAAYYGEMGINKITERVEPVYPKKKRILKFYAVSVPVIGLCLGFATWVMFIYFWIESLTIKRHAANPTLLNKIVSYIPGIGYTCAILIMNAIYRRLAAYLNDWENHRLQSAYDNHLVVKLVLFDFVNNFLSLFYIAFYLRDMATLRTTLATFVIVQQVIGQIQESLIPYLLSTRRTKRIIKEGKLENCEKYSDVTTQAKIETTMDYYEGTLDDYLELFIQYGYVFLFSSVFPMAAFWALLNNITEIRSDAFKMCRIFQRPFSKSTDSIGAWQAAFEMLGIIAVMTNCALIAMSPSGLKILADWGPIKYVLLFITAEHLVLSIQVLLLYLIPNIPNRVECEMLKTEYKSKQALCREFMQRNSKRTSSALLQKAVSQFSNVINSDNNQTLNITIKKEN